MSQIVNKFLAQVPADTLKGNNTGSTANVMDLTVAEVQAMLSIPTSGSPLAVLAGGTGTTTSTGTGSVVLSNSPTLITPALGTPSAIVLTNASGVLPVGVTGGSGLSIATSQLTGSVNLTSQVSGILPIANGGTNASTAAAAFNNLSPMTTTGDIIYEASAGVAAALPIGSTGQVLTVVGGIPAWAAAPASGANTSLSNLTTTSINQSLIPASTSGAQVLGSSANYWGVSFISKLSDLTPTTSVDIFNRQLINTNATVSVDWNNNELFDSSDVGALNWQNRQTIDSAGVASIAWSARALYSKSGFSTFTSVDWQNRNLVDTSAATQLNWSTSGVAFSQLTPSTVPYLNSSSVLTASAVTPTQLGYLSGASGTTGTGNLVLSASPTFTGTVTAGALSAPAGLNITAIGDLYLSNNQGVQFTIDSVSGSVNLTASLSMGGSITDNLGSSALSIDPNARKLYGTGGYGDPAIQWGTRILYATSNSTSIDWQNRILNNGFGTSIDWFNCKARDSVNTGAFTLNWSSMYLADGSGNQQVNWNGHVQFPQLTASTVPYLDASSNLVASSVTPTQLGYLSGASGTTGTGNLVLSASPTFTGTVTAGAASFSSAVNMSSNKINNLANGTVSSDAINLGQLQAAITGLYWQGPAQAYADSNVPLTGGATLTIDGYSARNGDLVILGNQTTASQNGEYTVSGIGSAYVLTPNGLPTAAGDAWLILNGTVYSDSAFVANAAVPAATFTEFAGPTAYTFTAPLVLSGRTVSITQATTSTNGYLSSTDWNTFNNKQTAGNYITALTGDATASGPGSAAITLATVNSNVGTFGSSTSIPTFTVNAKGLITAASGNAVVAPAGTLSGTTLNSTVVTSSLTTVGTIGTGTWQGTPVGIAYGGTGQTTASAGFNALAPATATGGLIVGSGTNTYTNLPIGTSGYVLTVVGGTAAWSATAATATNGKDTFVLNSTDITNQYVTLSHTPLANSTDLLVAGGGDQLEGASYDYTVSGAQIQFRNGLATGGVSALVAGDIIQIQYEY